MKFKTELMITLSIVVFAICINSAFGSETVLTTPRRISGPIADGKISDPDFQLSANGQAVVYHVRSRGFFDDSELFSVPAVGGTPIQLNHAPLNGGALKAFSLSSDSSKVVFIDDLLTSFYFELFSVPIQGGTPSRLSGAAPFPVGAAIIDFQISPDSQRVVYISNQLDVNALAIFSVSIDGGTPIRLNGALPQRGIVGNYMISPDGATVVYVASQNVVGKLELYSVPITGGTPVLLSRSLPDDADVISLDISSNNQRVVYAVRTNSTLQTELFSVPLSGGVAVKLNDSLTDEQSTGQFRISPDSQTVIYTADQNTTNVIELFGVPIGGGASTRLNADLTAGGNVTSSRGFLISPDSQTVIYHADQNIDEVFELFSVPVSGGSATRLNSNLPTNGDVSTLSDFLISPNSRTVVYMANQISSGVFELFSVPITGGTPVRLNGPLVPGGNVAFSFGFFPTFLIAPDSHQVAYIADQDRDNTFELFTVEIDGGPSERVSTVSPFAESSRTVTKFLFGPDSSNIVYSGPQSVANKTEFHSVRRVTLDRQEEFCFPLVLDNQHSAYGCL